MWGAFLPHWVLPKLPWATEARLATLIACSTLVRSGH